MTHRTRLQRVNVLQVWPAVVEVAAAGGTLFFLTTNFKKKSAVQSHKCKFNFAKKDFQLKFSTVKYKNTIKGEITQLKSIYDAIIFPISERYQ